MSRVLSPPLFTGVGVALVTLFDDAGDLDAKATAAHAARLVDRGVQAVLVSGTTGEAAALTRDERVEVLERVRDAVPAGVPVLAGTGAPSARQAAAFTADAAGHGADAALVLSPPGAENPRPYYAAVADAAGDLALLAYHLPAVSPPGIALDVLPDLPVRGLKDSSGDANRLLEEVVAYHGDVYTGAAALLCLAGPVGAVGAILALANVAPESCAAAFSGDAGAQRRLLADHRAVRANFPTGIKERVAREFGTSTVTRLG